MQESQEHEIASAARTAGRTESEIETYLTARRAYVAANDAYNALFDSDAPAEALAAALARLNDARLRMFAAAHAPDHE